MLSSLSLKIYGYIWFEKKKEKQPISKENIKTTFKRPEVLKIIKKIKSGSKIQRNKQ